MAVMAINQLHSNGLCDWYITITAIFCLYVCCCYSVLPQEILRSTVCNIMVMAINPAEQWLFAQSQLLLATPIAHNEMYMYCVGEPTGGHNRFSNCSPVV